MYQRKMDYVKYEQRLAYLVELASKGRFLSLSQVSKTFDCNKRTVKRMLNHLRQKGIRIHYSPALKKFLIDFEGDK